MPPIAAPENRISAMPSLVVNTFRLEGAKIIPEAELQEILKPYTRRSITAEELQEARAKLTQHYIQQGYINSGAVIPDQEVRDGVVTMRIVEGRLTAVELRSADPEKPLRLKESYVRGRLGLNADAPLNIKKLQEHLQILQQNPLIKRFDAELGPGLKSGEAFLNLELEENRPLEYGISLNNHRSPSVGAYRLEADARHRNLTGYGDSLYARYGLAQGLNDATVEYTLPLSSRDTTLALRLDRNDSQVISSPFDLLDVESKSTTYALTLRHPFYVAYTEDFHFKTFDMGLGLEKRRSETTLLGRPYSFPPLPNEAEGVSNITAIRFSQNWLDRSRNRVIAFASTFGIGIDALDATINDGLDGAGLATPEPDSEFVTWVGQLRWVERLQNVWDSQLHVRLDMQYASTDLLALEKFSIGGSSTVRGYRENQLTRDRGVVASLEWRIPVGAVKIPGLSEEGDGALMIAPFVDYGTGSNVNLAEQGPDSLASVGIGLLWNPTRHISAELYWGKALNSVEEDKDRDLQDDGVHFALDARF